ncbi:uncharacterized protein BO88DRAFT_237142 [Aspergillus vadensis CBS 113365]|uniref:Uncharacterized protein n=1 Tax=Aspergillus vadensis (strain CBS 113365 / IMI 142717 / IBT 24658) TaxID=1448311 RepID=A0A319BEN6_ASPVC|nr:hypothetical protein BO88DRAFT_237142 [Aspergillus vadensis CBS 113365]PYH71626.1 hypothetical protein BO88DRAFT_237142 [Aspergillus vadensis CBS 113365]
MKLLTVLYAMLFATFAVAGPAQTNGQDENTVEKRQSWALLKRLAVTAGYCSIAKPLSRMSESYCIDPL